MDQSYCFTQFLGYVFGYDSSGPVNPLFGNRTGKQWIVEGSVREDDGKRALNHFYDPVDKQGLTDPLSLGFDSFTWATNIEIGTGATTNPWDWRWARIYEYNALTQPLKADRDANFADMFRALGQVVHLLEDTSQPEHVRNTQHYRPDEKPTPFMSYIEEYGKINYPSIFAKPYAYNHANVLPLPSTQDGLKNLWDRNILSSGLSDSGTPDSLLGLAEFSNKNFLGIRSLYGELDSLGGIHHYAHPSLNETNIHDVLEAFGKQGVVPTEDKDGVVRNGIYISKVSNGLHVRRHSRLTYLASSLGLGIGPSVTQGEAFLKNYRAAFTIHDDLVEKEYLEVLLPTAVSYASSCLDYFFRDSFPAMFRWNNNTMTIELFIWNAGGCTLDGGSFEIWYDDDDGTRKKLTSVSLVSHLDPVDQVIGTIHGPVGTLKNRQCIIIYRGNLTPWTSTVGDPVDNHIAIAVGRANLPAFMQYADTHRTLHVKVEGVQPADQDSIREDPFNVDVSTINTTTDYTLKGVSWYYNTQTEPQLAELDYQPVSEYSHTFDLYGYGQNVTCSGTSVSQLRQYLNEDDSGITKKSYSLNVNSNQLISAWWGTWYPGIFATDSLFYQSSPMTNTNILSGYSDWFNIGIDGTATVLNE